MARRSGVGRRRIWSAWNVSCLVREISISSPASCYGPCEPPSRTTKFPKPASSILERGEKIKVAGFGNFVVRRKVARKGRNPKTGEEIEISRRRVVTFRPSQILRKVANPSSSGTS